MTLDITGDNQFQRLAPFRLTALEVCHWFCYYVPAGHGKKVHIFRACPESREILIELYGTLFLNPGSRRDLLEDL